MDSLAERLVASILAIGSIGCWSTFSAIAQELRGQAVAGEPLGVGYLEVELPRALLPETLGAGGLRLVTKDNRVLYPAIEVRALGGLLRTVLDRPEKVTIYFLFQQSTPLEVTVHSQAGHTTVLTPFHDAEMHRALLHKWWAQYTAPGRLFQPAAECPPVLEAYLRPTLARRLTLPLPQKPGGASWESQLAEHVGLSLATETVRLEMIGQRLGEQSGRAEKADQSLPDPVDVPPLEIAEPGADVEIEPIAQRVPAECFYARFGSFSNLLWFQDTLDQWGGDLRNLLAQRGLDYGVRRRMETRLALRQTALARMLGSAVIADVAMVGSDLFFHEGAAFGLLLQARANNALLRASIDQQRAERKKRDASLTEQQLVLDGRPVALLSSPDGRVRSFYAADGDFHFVTTSKTLARRFLETRSGKGTLGASKEFRHARSLMPVNRNDTILLYLSDAFFRHFTSPRYRIELMRRLQALADVEAAQLAQWVSAAEGKPGGTIDALIAGGLLPTDFGPRPDGSRTVLDRGEAYDSLRGRRGAFLPIPDVQVSTVTRAEAAAYRRFAEFYRSHWQRLDPILVAIKREAVGSDREHVVIDARMTPVAREQYELLGARLGTADKKRLATVAGDVAAGEVILPKQRLFGGLQNLGRPTDVLGRFVPWTALFRMSEGYWGYLGAPEGLNWLEEQTTGPVDTDGFARGPLGIWRYRQPTLTVYSFQRRLLEQVTGRLRLEEAERPAQVRLRVGDVSQGPIAPLLNDLGYGRARQASLGNLRLMHALVEQLHVPIEQARTAAETLLDAQLVCPLGGQYVFRTTAAGIGYWTSTALAEGQPAGLLRTEAPPGYQTPPLNWFRGLDLDALLTPSALSLHAEMLMQKPAARK